MWLSKLLTFSMPDDGYSAIVSCELNLNLRFYISYNMEKCKIYYNTAPNHFLFKSEVAFMKIAKIARHRSSTNKADRHDIHVVEIMFNVALNAHYLYYLIQHRNQKCLI